MAPKKRVTKKQTSEEAEAKQDDSDIKNQMQTSDACAEGVVSQKSDVTCQAHHKDPVILQLPIVPSRLEEIMENTNMHGVLEYNPNIVDPQPYIPDDAFHSNHDTVTHKDVHEDPPTPENTNSSTLTKQTQRETSQMPPPHGSVCYWCCHNIPHIEYGMPIRYDVFHKSFTLFGSFCSLECVAAYNFTTHMGSDRVWEIHSWIQMLAHRYGYPDHIRPAPSRYLLKMFNGPMTIEEFRGAHKGLARTYLMNIPPFIHIVSQMEVLNTSFLEPADTKKLKRVTKAVQSKTFGANEAVAT